LREFPRDVYSVARGEKTGDLDDRMRPTPESSTQEVLAGLVERVTFHNAENGFCVLRAKARGHRDLVTVVGHAAIISAGEWITASGEWTNDRTHGPAIQGAVSQDLSAEFDRRD
jgi:exodeoxyribonuclease V alpha subunit